MARTTGRSGFKMKSSPAKGLSNFFSSLGASLVAKKTSDIGGKMKSKYSGEAQRADKVARPGESEYQFKVRTRKARAKAKNKETERRKNYPLLEEIKDVSELEVGEGIVQGPKQKPKKVETKKVKTSKPDWSKAPKVGTQARTNWYKKFNLKLDETTPGFEDTDPSYKIIQGKYGPVSVIDDNPIPKKSPYKKGIGKYAKKAKGSRGYTMKRNK